MGVTTDPNDPRLGKGVDKETTKQNEVYLVLSEEEIAKGFVRPYRDTYIHVGTKIKRHKDERLFGRLIKIDDPEYDDRNGYYTEENGYGGYIKYPDNDEGIVDKFITKEELNAIIERKTHLKWV